MPEVSSKPKRLDRHVDAQADRLLAALVASLDDEERGILRQINEALRRFCQERGIDVPSGEEPIYKE